jgi:putative iron-only hydrogenase system regulator
MEIKMDKRVASVSIIVENPERASEINEILHTASEYIVGRMGIPYREKNISIISVVMDAPQDVINNVSGRLGRLHGVTAKTAYAKK